MKKFLFNFVFLLVIFPLLFSKKVMAAALQITNLGTMNVTELNLGGSLKSYTYSGGTFELRGLASSSGVVSITIDDFTQTATADEEGSWTTLISSLTGGQHQFYLTSGEESLDFILIVGLEDVNVEQNQEVVATEEATITTAGDTSETLPQAGSTTTNILFFALAMFSIGLGLALKTR